MKFKEALFTHHSFITCEYYILLLFKGNVPRDDLNDDFHRNTRAFARPNKTPAAQAISVTHRRFFNVGNKRVSVDDF